jgi:hypothetical protein
VPTGSPRLVAVLWFLLTTAAFGVLVASWLTVWFPLRVPDGLVTAAAVTVTTCFAFALGARTGGRPVVAAALALLLLAATVASESPVLLAGAALATATLGAVLGVMATVPVARFRGAVRECLVAVLVAVVAGFAAQAYDAQLSVERAGYIVLTLALVGALGLVYRLGAGVHGLGRRGVAVVLGGLVLLAVVLAYTEALARWGSPGPMTRLEDLGRLVRDTLGAVPRPIEVFLGFPALAWGVTTRARRRQGWWPCAFGAAGLSQVSTGLLDPSVTLAEAGLTLAYGAVAGLLLGYGVIRLDAFLSGNRGVRARRAEAATAHRPEPSRLSPLL